MSYEAQIKVYESDKRLLEALKRHPAVQERAVEEGVAVKERELSYDELLRTLIPADAPELSLAEEDQTRLWVRGDLAKDRVQSVAGRGVSQRRAILTYAALTMRDLDEGDYLWDLRHAPDQADIEQLDE